ncbi:MAG: ferredoxin reductase family protein [Actinobacteria bacterium]|nr:ferredoxin reductase family protein [Actinomycetota bacterium]
MTTITFEPPASTRKKSRAQVPTSLPSRPPRALVGKLVLLVVGLGLGATIGSALTAETKSQLVAPGGVNIFIGNLTGLVGMYLALVMLLLVSRLPIVERIVGFDGLLHFHRRLGPWPIGLLVAHALFITIGYAQSAKSGLFHELNVMVTSYPYMIIATVALVIMVIIGISSIRFIRSRLRREVWWSIHLYMYLALALSFAHVIALGPSFVGHPLARILWSFIWLATAGLVLVFRLGLPVFRTLRHGLRVVEIRRESPGITSVICSGRHLERLRVSGGQFFEWRFLTPKMWWQAHPYSLSAVPRPPYLRLTVKHVGDHSSSLVNLRPGTRVAIEGPYGAFTPHALRSGKAVLIAGGIGITAMRSLLEDLSKTAKPIVVVRATQGEDVVFRDELVSLAKHRRGSFHEFVGPRDQVRFDETTLRNLVPDLAQRDVYLCGPKGFVHDVGRMLREIGISPERIHHEAFSL